MPVEVDFEDEYDKADPIDGVDLKELMTLLNEWAREQKQLLHRFRRTEWTSVNEDEQQKLKQQITLIQKKQEL